MVATPTVAAMRAPIRRWLRRGCPARRRWRRPRRRRLSEIYDDQPWARVPSISPQTVPIFVAPLAFCVRAELQWEFLAHQANVHIRSFVMAEGGAGAQLLGNARRG